MLRELTAPGFLPHVERAGAHLAAGLARLAATHGGGPTRGRGLLQVLPLSAAVGPAVVAAALQDGLLLNAPQPSSLRFMPALNVTLEEIDAMLTILDAALRRTLS